MSGRETSHGTRCGVRPLHGNAYVYIVAGDMCRDHLTTIFAICILAIAVCSGKFNLAVIIEAGYTLFFLDFTGDVVITLSPQNFTASVGATATFQCEYTGTSDIPLWEIGGTEYGSTALPPQHLYTANGLRVENVQSSMNNTKYICILLDYDFTAQRLIRVRSNPAYLFVKILGRLGSIIEYIIYNTTLIRLLYI